MRKKKFFSKFAPLVLLGIILGSSIYAMNAKMLLKDVLPMPFGIGTSVVMSGSMEPTLHVNDLVFIKADDSYSPGDIVVYQSGSSAVIHRLISVDGTTAVTKGDANNVEDSSFAVTDIKGKMVFVIHGAGTIVRMLQSAAAKLTMSAAAIGFLILSYRKDDIAHTTEKERVLKEIEDIKKTLEKGGGENAKN